MIASQQLRSEIESLLRRYSQESDVTLGEAIGVLEIVKFDLLASATQSPDRGEIEEE